MRRRPRVPRTPWPCPIFSASWGMSQFSYDETAAAAKGKVPASSKGNGDRATVSEGDSPVFVGRKLGQSPGPNRDSPAIVASPRLSPLLARRLAVGPNQWSVATRPRRPEVAVDQTLSIDFDGSDAEVRFDARLTASAGYVFQHRIEAPAELKIDRVSVSAGGAGRSARWSRESGGAITVFLMDAVAGTLELSIRGRLPARFGTRTPLPEIAVAGGRVQSYAVQLLRRGSVSVRVEERSGLIEVKDPPAGLRRPKGNRLVGWYRVEGDKPPKATLVIAGESKTPKPPASITAAAARPPVARAVGDRKKSAPPRIVREESEAGGRERVPGRRSPGVATRRLVPRRGGLRRRARQGCPVPLDPPRRLSLDRGLGGRDADAADAPGAARLALAAFAGANHAARGNHLRQRGRLPQGGGRRGDVPRKGKQAAASSRWAAGRRFRQFCGGGCGRQCSAICPSARPDGRSPGRRR